MVAEGADGAGAVAGLAGAGGGEGAVEGGGVGGELAVGGDEGAFGEFLAAVGGDEDLAFGDDGGCEVEQEGGAAVRAGEADAERVGGEAAAGAAEGGDEFAVLDVDEVDRDQAGFGSALAPVADAADMAGAAEGDEAHAGFFRALAMPRSTASGPMVWPKP